MTMPNDYQMSSAYLRLILQGSEEVAELVIDTFGPEIIETSKSDYISGSLVNKMYEAFAAKGLDSWIIDHGSQLGVGSHGPLGFAALSAPNLEIALETLSEFLVIRTTGFKPELRKSNNRFEFILHDRTDHPIAGRWIIEAGFLVVYKLIETLLGHSLGDNANLTFTFPRIKDHKKLENYFRLRCKYKAAVNSLSIPSSWLEISSPLSDPDTFRSNIAKCRELKLALSEDKSDVLNLVSTRLQNHFDRRISNQNASEKIPSLETLADELAMSPRTLIRKLDRQNTSYKNILEQIRFDQAKHLLKQTHLTAAEISGKLGYQEPANFGRAFKRWSGQTPSNWRRDGNIGTSSLSL